MNENVSIYDFKEKYKFYDYRFYEVLVYSIISFGLPFIIKHPQWLIGIIVNAFLIRCAINFKLKTTLPVILLPSLGVLSAGVIFGKLTKFLIYLIPVIWLGNTLYVLAYKYIKYKKLTKLTIIIPSVLKAIVLSTYTIILITFFGFPKALLFHMSLLQLITAIIGEEIGVLSNKISQKLHFL